MVSAQNTVKRACSAVHLDFNNDTRAHYVKACLCMYALTWWLNHKSFFEPLNGYAGDKDFIFGFIHVFPW